MNMSRMQPWDNSAMGAVGNSFDDEDDDLDPMPPAPAAAPAVDQSNLPKLPNKNMLFKDPANVQVRRLVLSYHAVFSHIDILFFGILV